MLAMESEKQHIAWGEVETLYWQKSSRWSTSILNNSKFYFSPFKIQVESGNLVLFLFLCNILILKLILCKPCRFSSHQNLKLRGWMCMKSIGWNILSSNLTIIPSESVWCRLCYTRLFLLGMKTINENLIKLNKAI